MEINTPLDGAEYIAKLGYPVFPLAGNSVIPLVSEWHKSNNTLTPKKSEFKTSKKKSSIDISSCNWGVFCRKLVVIDIDIKENRPGKENWESFCAEIGTNPYPDTLTVKTPSGGLHLYFGVDDASLTSTQSVLAKFVDTRVNNGFAICPGSVRNNRTYRVIKDLPVLSLPETLHQALRNARPSEQDEDRYLGEQGVIEPGERHNRLRNIFIKLKQIGVDAEGMHYFKHWLISRCLPSFDTGDNVTDEEVSSIIDWVAKKIPTENLDGLLLLGDTLSERDTASLAHPISNWASDTIPKRTWHMTRRMEPGKVSAIVSAGGTGKSRLLTLDAVSIATGRPLSGFDVPEPGSVWLHNTEDSVLEMRRKLAAVCVHFQISQEEIKDRIFLSSASSTKLCLVEENHTGLVVNADVCHQIIKFIKKHNIKVWFVDPFVRVHRVDENKNVSMDAVMEVLLQIMNLTSCSIVLSHHTNKAVYSSDDLTAGLSRGASALVNATRLTHVMRVMTEKEYSKFHNIDYPRQYYVRLENVKENNFLSLTTTGWYIRRSVLLENGDEEGALEPVELQTSDGAVTDEITDLIRRNAGTSGLITDLINRCQNDPDLSPDLQKLDSNAFGKRVRRRLAQTHNIVRNGRKSTYVLKEGGA